MNTLPVCPYCEKPSVKKTGDQVYPGRRDLARLTLYVCGTCDARVGCHPGTETPLGGLANAATRMARMAAHDAFDPLWRDKSHKMSRSQAYTWLAGRMGLTPQETHLGMFNEEQCAQVVDLCANIRKTGYRF